MKLTIIVNYSVYNGEHA